MNSKIRTIKLLLWAVCGIAAAVALMRLVHGLGATTNLSDAIPWGLWKGFGVVALIALAAGGFVLTGAIHVFRLERYHDVLRPAVLTSFLGYSSAAAILTFDIGISWRIWHPIFFWQIHSPLFEVAWCVMLYLTVLILEFSPIVLEYFPRFSGVVRFMKKFTLPLVILGVMISCLHQSTLGTIFLITPLQLHPLWYSSILPVLFIISAAGLGITVVATELLVVPSLYGRKPNLKIVSGLGRTAAIVLIVYFFVRIIDLLVRGALPGAFSEGSWERYTFLAEMLLGILLPGILLNVRRIREKPAGLVCCALLIFFGIIFHRIAVSGLAMTGAIGQGYFPSWSEFALMAGILSAASLFYLFAVEKFAILEHKPVEKDELREGVDSEFGPGAPVWLGDSLMAGIKKYSLAFVVAFSIGFMMIPFESNSRAGVSPVPVQKARGRDVLRIDGNNDGFYVEFDHKAHIDRNGNDASCKMCHHLRYPHDKQTECATCHAGMYCKTSIFSHDSHVRYFGGNHSCSECHPADYNRGKERAKGCKKCHEKEGDPDLNLIVPRAPINKSLKSWMACSYTDAFHSLCVSCHKQEAERTGKSDFGLCSDCHKAGVSRAFQKKWVTLRHHLSNKGIITTPLRPPVFKQDLGMGERQDGGRSEK